MGLPAISGSDIWKLLEKVPQWVGISRQVARIGELESRVAALEAALAAKPSPNRCTICREGEYRTYAEGPDPTFGVFGMRLLKMRCDRCGHETERQFDPAKG